MDIQTYRHEFSSQQRMKVWFAVPPFGGILYYEGRKMGNLVIEL